MPQKFECMTCGFSHIFTYAETPALLKTCSCGSGEMKAVPMPEPEAVLEVKKRFTPYEVIALIDAHAQAMCPPCRKSHNEGNCAECIKEYLVKDLGVAPAINWIARAE